MVFVNREYRDGCMLERNRYLVDHAGTLLAVYNGERDGGDGALCPAKGPGPDCHRPRQLAGVRVVKYGGRRLLTARKKEDKNRPTNESQYLYQT